jgi:hypothetical protein
VRVDPLRLMRGAVLPSTPANIGVVGLYNNSAAAHFIAVYAATAQNTTVPIGGFYAFQGRLANQNTGTVVPVTTGEAPGPGQIDNDDLASTPPLDNLGPSAGVTVLGNDARFPIAVLRPGWSFVAVSPQPATNFFCSFIWEWLLAEDFYRRNPDIVLEEILASLKG